MSRENPKWYEPEDLLCTQCGYGSGEPPEVDVVFVGFEGDDSCPRCGSGSVVGCGPAGGL